MPLGANKAAIMGVAGVSAGDVVLLSSQTADSDASITFSSGITSTYGEYIFKFYNLNPETDNTQFTFQVNATDGADYNDSAITSTWFTAVCNENGVDTALYYDAAYDQAQGTSFQILTLGTGNGGDESCAGTMHLFNPSSTTYMKQWYVRISNYHSASQKQDTYVAGYINDTTAIDDIQFKFASGDFEGKIKMWGVN